MVGEQVIVRRYIGNQAGAMKAYQRDAINMAATGYFPTSQIWTPGEYGCGSFLLALLLCIILIGILVFIYMLIVKPEGTLTVTYEFRGPATGPINASNAQSVTSANQQASVALVGNPRSREDRLQLARILVACSCAIAVVLSFEVLQIGAAWIATVALVVFAVGWSIGSIRYPYKVAFVFCAVFLAIIVNSLEPSNLHPPEKLNTAAQHDSQGRDIPTSVTNDSELLIYRCGSPDVVLDTSEDDPRPLIPTRTLTYRKAHLKVTFTSNAPMSDPPPYRWKLFGLIDTRTNKAIAASDLQTALQERMPCMIGSLN